MIYRKTARNFNPAIAMTGKVTVAEVEQVVEITDLAGLDVKSDGLHLIELAPGVSLDELRAKTEPPVLESEAMDVVIVASVRTAIGKFNDKLSSLPAHQLGSSVITELLRRSGVAPTEVSEVIMGQVLTAAAGQNPPRRAAIGAGLPVEIPA